MICKHCGVDNPDRTAYCPNCGSPQATETLSNQPLETFPPVISSEQPSFKESPTVWQQPNAPEPAFKESPAAWQQPNTPEPAISEQPVAWQQPNISEPVLSESVSSEPVPKEQPAAWQQPSVSEPASPYGGNQLWQQPDAPEPAISEQPAAWQQSSVSEPAFREQPAAWQQPNASEPASPYAGNQLWEAFGTGSSPYQQSLSGSDRPSGIPQMPVSEPDAFGASRVTTQPLPPIRSPWTRALEPSLGMLAKPLPLWATIAAIAVVVLGIIVLQLTGNDWAEGAIRVAIFAGIVGLLVVVATAVRTLAGMRGRGRFIYTGLVIFLLLLLCLTGLTQQSLIHHAQGRYLEGQQQWTHAMAEFKLGGEAPPASDDLARTYVEWGEQLSATQQYTAAVDKFNTVLTGYSAARSEVARAQADEVTAQFDLANQDTQKQNYTAAASIYDLLLQLPYCNSTCHAQASALDATTYYTLAESQLTAQQYASAVTAFQIVTSRFSSSPEAQKVHPDLAKALLGQGKQQLTSDCSSAIPTYQQLSTQFADTLEGQEATRALQAPQPVMGHFVSTVPNSSTLAPLAILAKNLSGSLTQAQFNQALNGAPFVKIQSGGNFTFTALKQGTYDLVWGTLRSDGASIFTFTYNIGTNQPIHIAMVGPLCAFDFGDISETIPTPP